MSGLELLAALGAVAALAALFMCMLNLGRLQPPEASSPARADVRVSICIPARNEEANIQECVEAALASDHPNLEVLVYDDDSEDATRSIVGRIAVRDARCRLAPTRALPAGWNGKQHACAALAEAARGDWLLFTDADVRLEPDAVRRALHYAQSRDAALVSTFPRQRIGSFGELLLVPMMFFILMSYLPMSLMRRSLMPSASAGCGQFLLVQREAYRISGGHAGFRNACHDGVRLPRAFRRHGFRTDLFDGTDLASVRMYRGFGAAWRGFSKDAYEGVGSFPGLVAMTALHLIAHVWPWLLLGVLLLSLPLAAFADGSIMSLSGAAPALAGIAVAAAGLERLLLAQRFGHSRWLALLHPVTVLLMILLQWRSAWLHWTGRRTWRGRNAQGVRDEQVVLVDAEDCPLGTAEKLATHRAPGALHRAFSVFIFDAQGRTLLQKRAATKYHFGELWSNACCGHPRPGEALVDAARRRLREEMGICAALEPIGRFVYRAQDARTGLVEHELDHILVGRHEGPAAPDPLEAAAWRWVSPTELELELERAPAGFTPWMPLAWSALWRARAAASNEPLESPPRSQPAT